MLVNALPLTPDTDNLLDRSRLARLPAGAHLINVGRGAAIVDADLLALLDSGHLASATLDVFRTEPLPADHPFWHHAEVTVTPHLSGPTPLEPAAAQIAALLLQLEAGARAEELPGYVDRDARLLSADRLELHAPACLLTESAMASCRPRSTSSTSVRATGCRTRSRSSRPRSRSSWSTA